MHFVYKLIALSVVFGLVLTSPVAHTADPEFDDMEYEGEFNDMMEAGSMAVADVSRAFGVAVPLIKPGLAGIIGALFTIIPKIFKAVGLKIKAVTLIAKLIKWLAPKTVLIAVGVIATLVICKVTGLFAVEAPVVADYVPYY